jgi:uncharacterized membrane protein
MNSPYFVIDYRRKRPVLDWVERHKWLVSGALAGLIIGLRLHGLFQAIGFATMLVCLLLMLPKRASTRTETASEPVDTSRRCDSVNKRQSEAIAEDTRRGNELREQQEQWVRDDSMQQDFWDLHHGS